MGIDIGGAFTIAGASGSQALKIAGASDAFTIDTAGRTTYPNQIGFSAGISTDPGWIAQSTGWTIQNFQNATTFNKGGGYIAGRFTAPVAGLYLCHWSGASYKPSAVPGNYNHPQFWINGALNSTTYRLKGYWSPTGYSFNTEIVDLLYLEAGDYIDLTINHSAAGMSVYRSYCTLSCYLVG